MLDFDKTAYEEFWRYHDFSPLLNTGETIQSVSESLVIDIESGLNQPAMISGAAPYAPVNVKVVYKILAGVSGRDYRGIIRVVTTNSQKFEGSFVFKVK